MPPYHSTYDSKEAKEVCGAPILPIKTTVPGPALPCPPDKQDIVDEALIYFRANVLFRTFQPENGGDRINAYLTVWIGECLRFLTKYKDKKTAQKELTTYAMNNFSIPGEAGFSLGGFFPQPASRTDADTFRKYFSQLRQETARRLLDHAFLDNGLQNKWWMFYSKRKFMNIAKA